MPIDTNFPTWMLPKESPIDAMVKGVQIGTQIAQTQQAGQRLALQAQEQQQQMQLQEKRFQLDAETTGLRNQTVAMALDAQRADLPKWQNFVSEAGKASTPDELLAVEFPDFQSAQYRTSAAQLMSGRSALFAQTSDAKQYSDILGDWARLDANGKASVNEKYDFPKSMGDVTPGFLDAVGAEQDRMDKEKQANIIAQRVAAPTVAGEYRLENTTLSNEGRIAVQELRDKATQTDANGNVQSSPLILPDGSVDPYHAIIRSGPGGRVNKIVSVKNKDEMNGLTPSQKVSVLKTLETANRLQSQNFFLSKEDRASHASNAVEWAKELEHLLPGKGKASENPSGLPAVGEVRKGYKFKGGDPSDPKSWEKQ